MSGTFAHFRLDDPDVWELVKHHVKEHARGAIHAGKPLHLIIVSDDSPALDQQRAYYFGVVLKQIAEQAWVCDTQFSVEAWHEMLAKQILGCIEVIDSKGKPKLVRRSISRSASPPITVGEMANYIQEVMAFTADEFGVVFEG